MKKKRATLSPEEQAERVRQRQIEKAARARQRMIDKAKEYQSSTYCRKFVATVFQDMIRAEAGADPRQYVTAVVDGKIQQVERRNGQCVCITCGKVYFWTGTNKLDTGHFVASRRNSILLLEENCAPQCKHCNRDHHGRPLEYRIWMEAVRGIEVVERLQRLKTESLTFSRDDLVDMRIAFSARLKAAQERMKG